MVFETLNQKSNVYLSHISTKIAYSIISASYSCKNKQTKRTFGEGEGRLFYVKRKSLPLSIVNTVDVHVPLRVVLAH